MIDPAAATFELVAAEYDFGRPSWPPEAVAAAGLPRDADVLDLGAGTGKLTRVLLCQFDRVTAVEPLDGMRALIPQEAQRARRHGRGDPARGCEPRRRLLRRVVPLVRLAARAAGDRARPPAGRRADVAVEPGSRERRVAAGRSTICSSASRTRRARSVTRRSRGGTHSPGNHSSRFGTRCIPNKEEITAEALVARIGSWSNFTTLPPAEREALLAEIRGYLTEPTYRTALETHAVRRLVTLVVVGSGPNGLAGAVTLKRAGLSVEVHEAADALGGGARTAELTLPGFRHDLCSAIHPMGRISPFFRWAKLDVPWVEPPAVVAHPLDDGTAVVLERDLADVDLGADTAAYRRALGPIVEEWERAEPLVLGPFPPPLRDVARGASARSLRGRGVARRALGRAGEVPRPNAPARSSRASRPTRCSRSSAGRPPASGWRSQ